MLLTTALFAQPPLLSTETVLDIKEFPKGYFLGTNNYSKCASSIDQLRAYPVPRFMPGVKMHCNVNWIKAMWMANILNQNTLQPIHNSKIKEAVAIQNELAENWNYYYNFTENASRGYGKLEDKNTMINAAYIDDINTSGKKYPLACLTYRRQMDVTVAKDYTGCDNILKTKGEQRSLAICQKLESVNPAPPCSYPIGSVYPLDGNGNKITPNKASPNSWSPLPANRKVYDGDGKALEAALDKFLNTGKFHLSAEAKKRIEMLSEDNEVAPRYGLLPDGRNRLEDDKAVVKAAQAAPFSGNIEMLQAEAKKNIDNDYRDYVLKSKTLGLPPSCILLNYAVNAAINKHLYEKLRETQQPINGRYYPTPDLYISLPHLWSVESKGTSNGWQWLAISRYREIYDDGRGHAFNDQWFAPYISAGYNTNMDQNTRPGQYLGFCKALMLQGAEFFHPFVQNNIKQGNAYCWQAATPVYAQAIGSRLYHFLEHGKTLFGDMPIKLRKLDKPMPSFRFKSNNENYLITVRQDADDVRKVSVNRYAIVGAIMKTSNGINDTPLEANATFTLNKQELVIPVRRQGSTFIYDYTEKDNVVFYQLDKWHQYEHPDYWSRDFEMEAEVFDNVKADGWQVKSEGIVTSGNKIDLSNVISYIHFNRVPAAPLVYVFVPRKDGANNDYALWIRARSSGKSSMVVRVGEVNHLLNNINSKEWKWYEVTPDENTFFNLSDADVRYELELLPKDTGVEVDAIRLLAGK